MEPQQSNTAVLAAIAAAAIAFLANIVTTVITFTVARLNSKKDLLLQSQRLIDDKNKSEVAFLRIKLEEVHVIMSKIELENSQTLSFFHSTSGITTEQFRARYLENCERIHRAVCITDLYFEQLSPAIRKIYNEMNLFWGNQERLLVISATQNQNAWDKTFADVLAASNKISANAQDVQRGIARESKILTNKLGETEQK